MTPIQFLLEHREDVLSVFEGSPVGTWRKLVDQIQIDKAMTENTFRTLLKPFSETCRYFDKQLNETLIELNNQLNTERELNIRLNIKLQELNNNLDKCRLNVSDAELNNGLYESELNKSDEEAKSKLNILGWTVAKSGKYYRAFRKIKGRVRGVHLGKDLTDAEMKIAQKEKQLQA
jgi:hypothetical protein